MDFKLCTQQPPELLRTAFPVCYALIVPDRQAEVNLVQFGNSKINPEEKKVMNMVR